MCRYTDKEEEACVSGVELVVFFQRLVGKVGGLGAQNISAEFTMSHKFEGIRIRKILLWG